MAKRHVYEDGNPFGPELRERRIAEAARKRAALSATVEPKTKGDSLPVFERVRTSLHGLDVYSRHKQLINNYVLHYRGATEKLQRDTSNDRNIYDVIRENHRFLWNEEDVIRPSTSGISSDESQRIWEAKLAKKYYDKLFKEYCIADLSRYEKNQIAMRWRVEREVFTGKGQFICGEKRCDERNELSSWEVNFSYVEHGDRKHALVKLRLCPPCSAKLNFYSTKRLIKKEKREDRKRRHSPISKRRDDDGGKKRTREMKKEFAESSESSANEEDKEKEKPIKTTRIKDEPREDESDDGKDKLSSTTLTNADASEIWTKKPTVMDTERTMEEEFDGFIDDLLL